ncbi:MAG: type ISP restriction/modification enzyme [Ignavibacteriaceae bacterium]
MQNIFDKYINLVSKKFQRLQTSEMGYRTEFENLLNELFGNVKSFTGIDHDAKAFKGNKPDFVIQKNSIPMLYIEVKDIGVSLDKIEKSNQMNRYFGYANLVLSDYLEFRFYRNGFRYQEPIKIGDYDLDTRTITPMPENFDLINKSLIDFAQSHKEPIRSGEHLAKIMGGKAQRIRDNVRQFLVTDSEKNNEIIRVYKTIKKLLVHDLDQDNFADMYAQTLVYGLFVARYHDETSENFTRREARDLIPASNPLLRHFFDHITGINFDKRLEYIVNELCEVFTHADVQQLMKQYFEDDLWGKTHEGPDPVIHFYEDFLKEYDAELRKKLGAYYTPLPVVRFIVRSVDYLLEKEFGLVNGLADTSKSDKDIHRVQILDPAVGTGTFLSSTIQLIYDKLKTSGQDGRWPKYVFNDLLPRLHGFELMMAPYTIAHLKLSMKLKETGFKYFNQRRLGIYLTNSLEEGNELGDLFSSIGFAESIAEESKEAAIIKNNTPIMVVLGNPPYAVSSSNPSIADDGSKTWIGKLIDDYKKNLNEKKINLDDDYIKFIRFAEHFIEKSKTGIVAMITNNSFIDGITHRQMRKHLLEIFDDIYILDLHGSSKKKETAPDGGKDENVFDIQQGVSINIFVRNGKKKSQFASVYHSEVYGNRLTKFIKLDESNLNTIRWKKLECVDPYYFFVPKDFSTSKTYNSGFKVDELFKLYSSGIETQKDSLVIRFTNEELEKVRFDIEQNDEILFRKKYNIKDSRDWQFKIASKDILKAIDQEITYRPFDNRWTFYSGKTKGILAYPRAEVMDHLIKSNLALLTCRQQTSFDFQHVFISKLITERCTVSLQTGEVGYVFPLYLYNKDESRTPNFNNEIIIEIEKIVGKVTPEEILDYIYAVLYSPSYRQKYKEFLKIDFPRVPYPKDKKVFKEFVKLGTELRLLHLLESPKVNKFITTFPVMEGNEEVEKIKYDNGKVWINKLQYFGNVPEIAWNFYIGGYQPAQKWLKDRKDRNLSNQDIEHYQKIIVALSETDRLMKEIDKIIKSVDKIYE